MINTTITEPVFLRNLILYPISGDHKSALIPKTIEEVIAENKAEIRELETPDISEIVFDNKSDGPVLLLDGEEIVGSLQNRIMATSNFIEAKSSKNIPVICVEEGRWDEIGGFQTGHCSYPRIRTILTRSLHKKIDTQQVIWNEITRKLTTTKTLSATSSMHDIFDNLKDEVSRYLEGFTSLNHKTVGFIGVAGNRILGCDIFSNAKIYQKFEVKLVRSYALDATEYQRKNEKNADVDEFFSDIGHFLERWKIGAKNDTIKIKGARFLGQSIVHNSEPMHLSAFPR